LCSACCAPLIALSGAGCTFLPHHYCSLIAPASVCTQLFCVPCTLQYLQHGSILKDSSGKWVLDSQLHFGVDIIDPSIIKPIYQVCFCLRPRRSSLLLCRPPCPPSCPLAAQFAHFRSQVDAPRPVTADPSERFFLTPLESAFPKSGPERGGLLHPASVKSWQRVLFGI